MCSFSIIVPPATAIIKPTTTYTTATFGPKILMSRTRLPKSTIGEEIKKENVTPRGKPALVKPINNGMDEQEQKGVTVPRRAAIIFAQIPLNRPKIRLLRSGGKKLWMYEITKIRTQSSTVIFMTSYMKKRMLPPQRDDVSSPKADRPPLMTVFSHCIPSI